MALMTIQNVRKLLLVYSKGLSTRMETELGLIAAAADIAPALIAAELSDEWLAVLRNLSATLPASPSEILIIDPMVCGPEFDFAFHEAAKRQRLYDGAWNWHRHFTGLESL